MRNPARRLCRVAGALSLGAALLGPALAAPTASEGGLPGAAAPLGLRFGVTPQQIGLPVVVAPATPWTAARSRVEPPGAAPPSPATAPSRGGSDAGPVVLFKPGKAPVPVRRPEPGPARLAAGAPLSTSAPSPRPIAASSTQPQGWADTYIRACEAAFDSMSNLGNRSEQWRAWRAAHLGGGEGTDFGDFLAERTRDGTLRDSAELASALGTRRAGGLYRFDPGDARRVACLLFTADGLAQVFIAGPALEGLRDAAIERLDRRNGRTDVATFNLTREAERFSLTLSRPACGLYCRVFGQRLLVQRQFWLDEPNRVLIAAKRYATVSGLAAAFANDAAGRELVDGLPESFIVYSDLVRRARILQNLVEPPAAVSARQVYSMTAPITPSAASFLPAAGDRRETLIGLLVP